MRLTNCAKFLGMVTLAMGLATGCSNTTTSTSASTSTQELASSNEQGVQKIILDAKTALAAAEKGGYAWRDTGKFIKQAEEALAAGDTAKATSLATKALEQSELAKQQSIEQDKAVKERFSNS